MVSRFAAEATALGSHALTGKGGDEFGLVVVTTLKELDAVIEHLVHQSVRFRNAAGPDIAPEVSQVFGFPEAGEGVAQSGFDQVKKAQRDLAIRVNPEADVFQTLALNDRDTLLGRAISRRLLRQVRARGGAPLGSWPRFDPGVLVAGR